MAHIVANRVRETSTTTGTGALTLAGAMTGMITFAAAPGMAVGATCFYTAQAVDAGGALTGEWEIGLGTYSAVNTLTRTTILASSNAGAAVNFAAGTKQVFITQPAVQAAWARERLTAARTYYVRTDGSDANTGLANTAGGAFLTIQKAVDVVSGTLDLSTYNVTIQIADGTYTAGAALKSCVGAGTVVINGNATTPANVLISTTSADAIFGQYVTTLYTVSNLKITTITSGRGVRALGAPTMIYVSGVDFGAVATAQMYAQLGGQINATGNYTISGGAVNHVSASAGIITTVGRTCTLTGTPAFSGAFSSAALMGLHSAGSMTYTGSATGARYTATGNSLIDSNGGGATYLPGNAAHATPTATGGQYV